MKTLESISLEGYNFIISFLTYNMTRPLVFIGWMTLEKLWMILGSVAAVHGAPWCTTLDHMHIPITSSFMLVMKGKNVF